MIHTAYNVNEADREKLAVWDASPSRPALFLMLPPLKDIGEDMLVAELASRSYASYGFSDAFERHFMQRNFPFGGSPADYDAFLDDVRTTAEVTDGFYGVDAIDLTDWANNALEGPIWRKLIRHIRAHPETDFVFTARADDPDKANEIIRSIRTECGLAVEVIELRLPTPEALADAFVEYAGGRFAERRDTIAEWFCALQEEGRSTNFAFVQTCASAASYECVRTGDAHTAFQALYERYSSLTPQVKKSTTLGF